MAKGRLTEDVPVGSIDTEIANSQGIRGNTGAVRVVLLTGYREGTERTHFDTQEGSAGKGGRVERESLLNKLGNDSIQTAFVGSGGDGVQQDANLEWHSLLTHFLFQVEEFPKRPDGGFPSTEPIGPVIKKHVLML